MKRWGLFALAVLAALALAGCGPREATAPAPGVTADVIAEDGIYTAREDLALYVHTYGKLPRNFLTKEQARALGWQGGDLRPYRKDGAIGGDRFMNYEALLPDKPGRVYCEADVGTLGKASRGAERLVYSNDGLVYYSGDHYASFKLLYGEVGNADR